MGTEESADKDRADLRRAEAALAAATTREDAQFAQVRLRRAIQKLREDTRGDLAQTFKAAMALALKQKADGVPDAERFKTVERALRAAWPETREWKYLCNACDDTGWMFHECPKDPCERTKPHMPHSYAKPCFCSLGDKFRPNQTPRPDDDSFSAATRRRRK